MMREETVFGPIRSRRLGSSLGINLLPRNGKLCNFDCIYCECGWNKDGTGDRLLPTAEDVRRELSAALERCKADGTPIDSITFSGDGEPTLNPQFAEIIDITVALRDKHYPTAKISVLSNATLAWKDSVFEALRKVDNPIMKIDAPSSALAALINRPVGHYDLEKVISSLERFHGDFILQTMFLKAPQFSSGDWADGWMDIVRRLRPREIMVYTIDRETPEEGLEKYTVEEMEAITAPLLSEGFSIQIKG